MFSRSPHLLRDLLLRLGAMRAFSPFDDRGDNRYQDRGDDRYDDPWPGGGAGAERREADYWPARPAASDASRSSRPGARTAPARGRRAGGGGRDLFGLSSRRKLPILISLALAALLVSLATIGVEAQLVSRSPSSGSGSTGATSGAGTPFATFTPLPTQTPSFSPTPVNLAALGWVKRTLSWVERVASAPSNPSTVYACGGLAGQNNWVISFAVSQDSGHSWSVQPTTVQAAHCTELVVSPTAPQAIAIHVDTCPGECGSDQQISLYTLDGGAHWSPISSSCGCSQQPDDGYAIAWVGTTLFAIPGFTSPPQPSNEFLAKSTNGGSFTWLSLPADNQPGPLFTTSDTIYAVRNSDIFKSTDLGSTWAKTSAVYNGNPVSPLAMVPGAAMLGIDARWLKDPNPTSVYPLLRSTDGGATWQPAPNLPDGMRINADVYETPDGSTYLVAFGQALGQGGIYKLSPGASHWLLISPVLPGDLNPVAVTWNASGQPLTLWGLAPAQPGTSSPVSILYSHAA